MTERMAERMPKAESKPFAASEGIATSENKLRAEAKPFVTSKSQTATDIASPSNVETDSVSILSLSTHPKAVTSDPSKASNGVTSTSTQVESMAPDQVVPAGSDGLNQAQVVAAQADASPEPSRVAGIQVPSAIPEPSPRQRDQASILVSNQESTFIAVQTKVVPSSPCLIKDPKGYWII